MRQVVRRFQQADWAWEVQGLLLPLLSPLHLLLQAGNLKAVPSLRPPEESIHALRNLDGYCQASPAPVGDASKDGDVAKADDDAVLFVLVAKL